MKNFSTARSQRPGVWLGLAVAAALLTYTTGAKASFGAFLWAALSIWLAHRIWKGGATALAWYRGLQMFGLLLFGAALVIARWNGSFGTDATVGTVLFYALSVWFLMAPALFRPNP